ncbi:unnamed protein product, partial [Laminaria digitata]
GNNRVAEAQPTVDMKGEAEIFSPQWVREYSGDNPGCELGRVSYTWRFSGFGSNINNLINAWVYAIVVEGWSDLAVLMDSTQLPQLECSQESEGLVSRGWSCLFSNIPHLCTFDTPEMWKQHLNSTGVSAEDQEEADRLAVSLEVIRAEDISASFEALNIDQRGAKAVMATFLWSSKTLWLRKDMHAVTHVRETFETSPFIGLHIRRGDKLRGRDIRFKHDVEDYLAEAVHYLEQEPNGSSVDAVKGIWVASDATSVVSEVRALADAYFPSVLSEDIVFVAGGVPGGVQTERMTTRSNKQGYGSFVYLLADLEQLAAADVFVGTCSSNLGRLVMVLRDGLGKDKKSSISLDLPWYPKRQRSLALD